MTTRTTIDQFRENRLQFVSRLYRDLLVNGIRYFFPGATLQCSSELDDIPDLLGAIPSGGEMEFHWVGNGYSLVRPHSFRNTSAVYCAA
jgi:hypothetical protein